MVLAVAGPLVCQVNVLTYRYVYSQLISSCVSVSGKYTDFFRLQCSQCMHTRLFSLRRHKHYYSELPLGQLHCNWPDHLQKPSCTTVLQCHTSLLVMKAILMFTGPQPGRFMFIGFRQLPLQTAVILRDATLKEGAGQRCIHDLRPLDHGTTGFQCQAAGTIFDNGYGKAICYITQQFAQLNSTDEHQFQGTDTCLQTLLDPSNVPQGIICLIVFHNNIVPTAFQAGIKSDQLES